MMQTHRRGLGYACLAALFSAAFMIPYKLAGEGASAAAAAFGMLSIAALMNGALVWARRGRFRGGQVRARGPVWVPLALAALAVLGNICSARALTELGPATVSAVFRSEVLWVGTLGWLLLGEALTARMVAGAAIALSGLVVMRPPDVDSATFAGWGLAIGAAFCFAGMQLLNKWIAPRLDLVWVNSVRLWLCSALLLLIPGTLSSALDGNARFWLWCAAAALFGPFVSRLLLMYALRSIRAAEASLVMLLAPIFTLGLGWLAIDDLPTLRELTGGGLILLGVAAPLSAHLHWATPGSKAAP